MKARKIVVLGSRLDQQLGGYVAAATAEADTNRDLLATAVVCTLGLGSLAAAAPASAEIVYTPTNKTVGPANMGTLTLPVDLNNDGQADFNLLAYNLAYVGSGGGYSFASLCAVTKKQVNGEPEPNMILATSDALAAADGRGQAIGAGAIAGRFRSGIVVMAKSDFVFGVNTHSSSLVGQWRNVKDRYLGIRFSIGGEIHYGWARLTTEGAQAATLTGYAYETIPNKPILAGATEETQVTPVDGVGRFRGKRRLATLGGLAGGAGAVQQPNQ